MGENENNWNNTKMKKKQNKNKKQKERKAKKAKKNQLWKSFRLFLNDSMAKKLNGIEEQVIFLY